MGSKASAPKPDPNIGLAQKEMAGIAQQQLDFAEKAYYAEQPRLDRYAELADQFVQSQVQSQQKQTELADSYQQRMQGTFYPIEDTLAFDAMGYYDASPEVQAKLEQAYLSQNQNLVNQRYDDMLAQEEAQYQRGLSQYQSRGQALASGASAEELAAMEGELGTAKKGLQQASAYNWKLKKAKKKSSGLGRVLDVALPTFTLGMAGDTAGKFVRGKSVDTTGMKARIAELEGKVGKTKAETEEQAQLQKAYAREYDQYAINPETGRTYAEDQYQQRLSGLQAQRDQDLGNVGSSLDAVRAYAESYKSGQEQQAGMARQDVANQFDARNAQLQRQLQSFGVDPTSGRFSSTINQNNIMQAATEANAMNQARQAAKQLGWAKRMDAAGLGRGLPGNQATSTGLAQNAGQAALSGQQSISSMYGNANSSFMSGLGQAAGGFQSLGQLGLNNTQLAQNAVNMNNQASGALTGAIIGGLSQAGSAYLGR